MSRLYCIARYKFIDKIADQLYRNSDIFKLQNVISEAIIEISDLNICEIGH